MTTRQEFASWFAPSRVDTQSVPTVDSNAPSNTEIQFPRTDGKPVLMALLRHCGCPFAEKTFIVLRKIAEENKDIQCIAISHSDQDSTNRWVESVGGQKDVQVIVDDARTIYAAYGLSISSWWHVLSPASLGAVFKMGREENIWNRPTESGSRWQTAGVFAIDSKGIVRYSHPAQSAEDLGDLEAALLSIKSGPKV